MLASRASSAQGVAPSSSSRALPLAPRPAVAAASAAPRQRRAAASSAPLLPPPPLRHQRLPAPKATPQQPQQTAAGSHTAPGVLARWLFDCRYGTRTEATSLLQEWVSTVGAPAGCTANNTRLSAGAVGVPESRLELELSLPSLAAWEDFLARIDRQAHRAWSERAARLMVDGSTRWEVLRAVPVVVGAAAAGASASVSNSISSSSGSSGSSSSGGAAGLVFTPPGASVEAAAAEARGDAPKPAAPRDPFADALMSALGASSSSSSPSPSSSEGFSGTEAGSSSGGSAGAANDADAAPTSSGGPAPLLDWKGEPMQLNPGDKLPFKFL